MLHHHPRLPAELIDKVLRHLLPSYHPAATSTAYFEEVIVQKFSKFRLVDDDGQPNVRPFANLTSLRLCCLISEAWRARAQPLLWSFVFAHGAEKIEMIKGILSFKRPSRSSAAKKIKPEDVHSWINRNGRDLGSMIESLSICGRVPGRNEAMDRLENVFPLFGQMFPRLKSLIIYGQTTRNDFLSSGKVPYLRFLSLSNSVIYPHLTKKWQVYQRSEYNGKKLSHPYPPRQLKSISIGSHFWPCWGRDWEFFNSFDGRRLETIPVIEPVSAMPGLLNYIFKRLLKIEEAEDVVGGNEEAQDEYQDGDVEEHDPRQNVKTNAPDKANVQIVSGSDRLKTLSFQFCPLWKGSISIYLRVLGAWTKVLPLCPLSVTHLTLAPLRISHDDGLDHLLCSIPSHITSLTLVLDIKGALAILDDSHEFVWGYMGISPDGQCDWDEAVQQFGEGASDIVLEALTSGAMKILKRLNWERPREYTLSDEDEVVEDRSLNWLMGYELRHDLEQRGIKVGRD